MSISKYIPMENVEDVVEDVVMKLVMPGLEKLVLDSENKWDDAALAIAKPMLMDLIDKIDGKEG